MITQTWPRCWSRICGTCAASVLDAAREDRAQARTARYAARQAHERASTAVDRLQRRVRELSERLDGMAE